MTFVLVSSGSFTVFHDMYAYFFQWFREAVNKAGTLPTRLEQLLFMPLEKIYDLHQIFLREVEQRLTMWCGLIFMRHF